MQINNPLQMNDWQIKSCLSLILLIQLFFFVLVSLDLIKVQIPILRQLIPFIILTFIPGILILRILRIHDIGNVKTVLYSVGLSIGSLLLVGLSISIIYPLFGVMKPLSFISLFITINLFILLLSCLAYVRDKDFFKPNSIDINELFSPYFLFVILIPFFSIFGPYMLNEYGNNNLQMILLLIIALFPLFTLKWIPKKLYPLVILVLSFSLLFHTTLISSYVWGSDISSELILITNGITNGLWYPGYDNNINGMLGIVILGPFYSVMLNLSPVWCLKLVYPALFSLVPLGLFIAYSEMTNNKKSFLACIFFISISAFFTTLPSAARQEIAELFFCLIILIMVDKKIKGTSKSILLLLFAFALVVSHYGLAYIFLLIIAIAIIIKYIFKWVSIPLKIENIGFANYKIINNIFPLFILCFALAWFMYVANASIFHDGGKIVNNILYSITDVLNPDKSQGYSILISQMAVFLSIEKYLYIISEFLIGIGILSLLFDDKKVITEFKLFSIASFLVVFMGILIPYFAGAMNTDRLLHINMFFLAIYFVIGALTIIKLFNILLTKIPKLSTFKIGLKKSFYLVAIFLLIFSIFNTAFIYQIFDQPKMGKFALDNNQDFYTLNHEEISSISWLKNNNDQQTKIYSDVFKSRLIGSYLYSDKNILSIDAYQTKELTEPLLYSDIRLNNSYIFLSSFNIKNSEMYIQGNRSGNKSRVTYISVQGLDNRIFKIYDDGGSWILKCKGS